MEILIGIAPLMIFVLYAVIIFIQDWITDMRFYRRRHLRELKKAMRHSEFFSRTHDVSADEIKRAMHAYKTSGVTTYLPTGEVEVLGPGRVCIFDKQKVGTAIGTVGYEQLEEMGANLDEAEKLLKEAKEKQVN